jgi:hypothetical protein
MRIDNLNKQDSLLSENKQKCIIKDFVPNEYQEVIEGLDARTIDTIDYIRIMYKKPLKPEHRISVRKSITGLIDSRRWNEAELAFFVYLLEQYGCF